MVIVQKFYFEFWLEIFILEPRNPENQVLENVCMSVLSSSVQNTELTLTIFTPNHVFWIKHLGKQTLFQPKKLPNNEVVFYRILTPKTLIKLVS